MAPIFNFKRMAIYFSVASLIAIIIPFLSCSSCNNGQYLRNLLQNSATLQFCHLCSIGSIFPLAIELCFDLYSQNREMSSVAQLKERSVILIVFAAFSILFLSCRSTEPIPQIFVAANYVRENILVAAVYCAVYPDKTSNIGTILEILLLLILLLWQLGNVFAVYSFLFDNQALNIVSTTIQAFTVFVMSFALLSWMRRIANRQKATLVRFDQLTVKEYVAISYIIPMILQGMAILIWNIYTGDISLQNYTVETLVFQWSCNFALSMAVIIVPGRILQILAVTNMNLLRLKQIFVRYVSHEIRSPLNVVHAGLELLLMEIKGSDPTSMLVCIERSTAEFIQHMFSASESAINILNDLLQYEHMEAGNLRLDMSWQSLSRVLESDFSWARILAEQSGIMLEVVNNTPATELGTFDSTFTNDDIETATRDALIAAQGSAFLHLDKDSINQVIRNLITNAVKFTAKDGRVSIGFSCEFAGQVSSKAGSSKEKTVDAIGTFRLSVTDTGVGLSQEEQKKIFGGEFDANVLQGGGGSGLGLWLSRRIIHKHNGRMGVTSAGKGCGSTFYFELPLYSSEFVTLQQQVPPQRVHRKPSPGLRGRMTTWNPFQINQSVSPNLQPFPPADEQVEVFESAMPSDGHSPVPIFHSSVRPSGSNLPPDDSVLQDVADWEASRRNSFAGPVRLLIVDDSPMNVKVMKRLIDTEKEGPFAGAIALVADDGLTALEVLRNELNAGRQIHFILMDYIMVTMNGPDAARIMRQDLLYNGVIIGVTGNALPEDIDTYVSSGANLVITKPLTKAKLMEALRLYASF